MTLAAYFCKQKYAKVYPRFTIAKKLLICSQRNPLIALLLRATFSSVQLYSPVAVFFHLARGQGQCPGQQTCSGDPTAQITSKLSPSCILYKVDNVHFFQLSSKTLLKRVFWTLPVSLPTSCASLWPCARNTHPSSHFLSFSRVMSWLKRGPA